MLGLSVLSAVFHECGHAAGLSIRRRAARRIGVGIYLVWPVVLHERHRLLPAEPGRPLRTDLGGLYFNLIFMLVLAGIYAATSAAILLLVIAVTHLEMLEQLLPFVRFDGYFILSDLVGVPDLFARIAPCCAAPSPGAARTRAPPACGARARIVITVWVLWVIPLLTLALGYLLLHLPPDQPGAVAFREPAGAPGGRVRWPGTVTRAAAVDAVGVALRLPVDGRLALRRVRPGAAR